MKRKTNKITLALGLAMSLLLARANAQVFDITAGGPIPDNGMFFSSFSFTPVSGVGTVQFVMVRVSIEHTAVEDLAVQLESPSGTTVRLHSFTGGFPDNIEDVLYEPTPCPAGETCSSASGPGSMVDFVGENADGIWTLQVVDAIRNAETGSVLRVGAAAPWGTAIGTQLIFPEDGDGDGVVDPIDNCPTVGNGDQADADDDGIGDACDPFPNDADHDKAQCFLDLTQAETDLATCEALPVFTDSDGDGEADDTDACPTTPIGSEVDQGGCSQAQFCALVDASTASGRRECRASDWTNDEPLRGTNPRDCLVERLTSTCLPR